MGIIVFRSLAAQRLHSQSGTLCGFALFPPLVSGLHGPLARCTPPAARCQLHMLRCMRSALYVYASPPLAARPPSRFALPSLPRAALQLSRGGPYKAGVVWQGFVGRSQAAACVDGEMRWMR